MSFTRKVGHLKKLNGHDSATPEPETVHSVESSFRASVARET